MDISRLTPAEIASLRQQLNLNETNPLGRSPDRPRQLHDLRLMPTKDDPRPTFFWSAEPSRTEVPQAPPFAQLLWESSTGREITVYSPAERDTYTAKGFVTTQPSNAIAPDQAVVARQQLERLSPEDRKLVLQDAHAARLERVKEMLLDLSDADREALIATAPTATRKSA